MERGRLGEAMEGTKASFEVLRETLAKITDDDCRAPSLLPGWTRGHLLSHIARNADSHVRMLEGTERGERAEQYIGGKPGRAADIEAGAGRSATELVEDVEESAQKLFTTWKNISPETWDQQVVAVHGGQAAWVCVFSRWRETEIHHVDLDLGYDYDRWPKEFLDATLPDLAATVDDRLPAGVALELAATDVGFHHRGGSGDSPLRIEGPGGAMLAWLSGRPVGEELTTSEGDLPELAAWL